MDKIQSAVASVPRLNRGAVLQQDAAHLLETDMDAVNARRLELIDKDTLSESEKRELDALQDKMSAYVNERYPLPFPALERLEKYAQILKERENKK